MHHFTPGPALVGGTLIGLAASLLIVATGRCAGISGIVDGALRRDAVPSRWTFLAGLLVGGLVLRAVAPELVPGIESAAFGPAGVAAAGLVVGFGARVGGGCTSGHGIVGNSRLSPRSLVATGTFMAAGFATVGLLRVLRG
jgi:hypothetical protein